MHEYFRFGPFTLVPEQRLLLRDGAQVDLGSRAFDILATLVSRPNQVVSKTELLTRVWPDVTVEEGSLRFHIANLRKRLGDGEEGTRYIATMTGRGYCFVAPLHISSRDGLALSDVTGTHPQANLPSRLISMVGRAAEAGAVSKQLLETRFVTLVGMGGIGKTTIAVSVGHQLVEAFDGAVHFVDLGGVGNPELVAGTVASMVASSSKPDDAVSSLVAQHSNRRTLLILDTCEHVISAAADLASRLIVASPSVHILATSREPLQVHGENVYKLAPLACPPDGLDCSVAVTRSYPATRLFIERAEAAGSHLDLNDGDAAVITEICRKLDGVPLAIELAAGRVGTYGLRKTSELLDERLSLLWLGRRTAPLRQKTLHATLSWSYELLSNLERVVLRRLAVFVADFSIDAALSVVVDNTIDETHAFAAIDSLVAKSMVATMPVGAITRYRLLDLTRAYTLQLDTEGVEHAALHVRHADYWLHWLKETGTQWPRLASAAQRSLHLSGLANVRAALDWCFGSGDKAEIGVRLAVAAAPVFLSMSLLMEDRHWIARAIQALGNNEMGGQNEMQLQAALGVSLMFTRGVSNAARDALVRSVDIAYELGDPFDQIQVLAPLQMLYLRTGEFRLASAYAQRCHELANLLGDSVSTSLAQAIVGMSLHLGGDLHNARKALEAGLRYPRQSEQTTTSYLGFDARLLAGAILARVLWLQGYPDQAVERAMLTIRDAEVLDHPLTLAIAFVWAVSVFLWVGDLDHAEHYADRLIALGELHALGPYAAVGRAFRGEIAIRRGDANDGVRRLQEALGELHSAPYEMLSTPFKLALAQGLAATRRFVEAFALIDDTMQLVEIKGDVCYLPELVRVKGEITLAASPARANEAQTLFMRGLELSGGQGARAWELRAAIDLANGLAASGRWQAARDVLEPVYRQFSEGFSSIDLQKAKNIIDSYD